MACMRTSESAPAGGPEGSNPTRTSTSESAGDGSLLIALGMVGIPGVDGVGVGVVSTVADSCIGGACGVVIVDERKIAVGGTVVAGVDSAVAVTSAGTLADNRDKVDSEGEGAEAASAACACCGGVVGHDGGAGGGSGGGGSESGCLGGEGGKRMEDAARDEVGDSSGASAPAASDVPQQLASVAAPCGGGERETTRALPESRPTGEGRVAGGGAAERKAPPACGGGCTRAALTASETVVATAGAEVGPFATPAARQVAGKFGISGTASRASVTTGANTAAAADEAPGTDLLAVFAAAKRAAKRGGWGRPLSAATAGTGAGTGHGTPEVAGDTAALVAAPGSTSAASRKGTPRRSRVPAALVVDGEIAAAAAAAAETEAEDVRAMTVRATLKMAASRL